MNDPNAESQDYNHIAKMPHSITPESTAGDDSPNTMSQVDAVKPEPETQDIAMNDAPSPPAAAGKPKVNLEDLFDDDDSDGEFASSAPGVKSEEDSSQPAPLYLQPLPPSQQPTNNLPARSRPNPPSPTPR